MLITLWVNYEIVQSDPLMSLPAAEHQDVSDALGSQATSECSGPPHGQRQTAGSYCSVLLLSESDSLVYFNIEQRHGWLETEQGHATPQHEVKPVSCVNLTGCILLRSVSLVFVWIIWWLPWFSSLKVRNYVVLTTPYRQNVPSSIRTQRQRQLLRLKFGVQGINEIKMPTK